MMPVQSSQVESESEPESAADVATDIAGQVAAEGPPVLLRGTRAGLEIVIDASASIADIVAELAARLEQSPGFFAGNDACVRVAGRLPVGALARLEEVTARFDLRIVEVGPRRPTGTSDPAATSSEPDPEPAAEAEAEAEAEAAAEPDLQVAIAPPPQPTPRMVIGPIRSGVVLDAAADLIVVGDVNPGAEIRARGNIIVLGRLRGVAHAAVGRESGFIFALRFEPQQLRIGRLVARAGESDVPGQGAEIAYATGRTIVVERYQGRVPSGLDAAA